MKIDRFKMIFWDFDGVIKESVSVKTEAFVELFTPYGENVCNKVRGHHVENAGISRFEKIPLYLKWSGIEPTKTIIDDICSRFNRIVKNKVINSDWVPGVETFLHKNKKKISFVIVSATPQDELLDICQSLNIENCFLKIYGSPKSKSSAIKECMINFDISPEKCVMIGDAKADINAAEENNISFVLRRHQYNKNLKIASNFCIIHDFYNF